MNAAVNKTGITQPDLASHPVVTPDRWIAERRKLLAREKELTRLRDRIAEQRRALPWVRIDKNYFTPEERAKGEVFHTYSTFGRGVEVMMGTYNMLDLAPKGRGEDGLSYGMEWVRHHDRYEPAPKASASCCGSHS